MSDNPSPPHIPTIAEVNQISALNDPVIRNLQITQCYHELCASLATRTALGANWCTFATWASKQAGQTIRKEDLERALENAIKTRPTSLMAAADIAQTAQLQGTRVDPLEIQESLWELLDPAAMFERASQAVGRGNKKVFEEIGLEFARFISLFLADPAPDNDKLQRFCSELRPGDPPDGQQYLRRAFARYYQCFYEPDAKKRAELLLLANIEIGFHEQTRLQPEIAEAMDAAFVDPGQLTLRLIPALFPSLGWSATFRFILMRLFGRRTPLDTAIRAFLDAARLEVRRVITKYMMTISFPHQVLVRLGEDLAVDFPPSLEQITDPELRAFLERVDPTPDNLQGSGAVDWSDLPDRLHFIVDLFRCYQESADLFDPPFTPLQVSQLKAGQRPEGSL